MTVAGMDLDIDIPLRDALNDLDLVIEEAKQDGFPIPRNSMIRDARRLLREMYEIWPRRFEVYPTQDGEISIDAPSGHGRLVVVSCAPNGSAECSLVLDGDYRNKNYDSAEELPDEFLRKALLTLRQESH